VKIRNNGVIAEAKSKIIDTKTQKKQGNLSDEWN
jgi:hypothetical protein